MKNFIRLACGLSLAAAAAWPAAAEPTTQNQMMYFRAFVQDDPACGAAVEDGEVVYPGITSPAATCPDAFAWAGFLTAIRDGFWTWATDGTLWPEKPLPLCSAAGQQNCCDPSVLDREGPLPGAPNTQCPYAPHHYADPPPLDVEPSVRHSPAFVDALDPGRLLRDVEVELVYRNDPTLR